MSHWELRQFPVGVLPRGESEHFFEFGGKVQRIPVTDLFRDLFDRHPVGGEQELGRHPHPEPDQILVGGRLEMLPAEPDEVALREVAGRGHVADREQRIGDVFHAESFKSGQLRGRAFPGLRGAQKLEETPAQYTVFAFGFGSVLLGERFKIPDETLQHCDIDRGDRIDGAEA